MNKIFVISDTHFYHKNILKFCDRPFSSIEEMNDTMLNNWNNVVSENDIVYHLGDFGLGNKTKLENIFDSLNGTKYLIRGNHDIRSNVHKFNWVDIYDLTTINYKEKNFVLCHYPMQSWDRMYYGSIHLYGHVHNNVIPIELENMYNVSADVINFTPKLLDDYM